MDHPANLSTNMRINISATNHKIFTSNMRIKNLSLGQQN